MGNVERPRVTRDVPRRRPAGRVRTQRGYTTMANRRKFIAGLGALATGSAAATGTGAFTQMSANRNANINVVNDSAGLIALKDDTPNDVVSQEGGQLTIDFDPADKGAGVNVDSYYRVGNIANYNFLRPDAPLTASADPYDDPAFYIVNNSNNTRDVTLKFTLDNSSESTLIIVAQDKEHKVDMNDPGAYIEVGDSDGDNHGLSDSTETGPYSGITLPSGGKAGVSIAIFTDEDTADDLSGTLRVSSGTDSS